MSAESCKCGGEYTSPSYGVRVFVPGDPDRAGLGHEVYGEAERSPYYKVSTAKLGQTLGFDCPVDSHGSEELN